MGDCCHEVCFAGLRDVVESVTECLEEGAEEDELLHDRIQSDGRFCTFSGRTMWT